MLNKIMDVVDLRIQVVAWKVVWKEHTCFVQAFYFRHYCFSSLGVGS
jgi:hypothetical protein